MVDDSILQGLASCLANEMGVRGLYLATAESCTGGWIGKCCTDLAGSSDWFECGFVTYSNQAKQDMLGVKKSSLMAYGAVSAIVAKEMAQGALRHSAADIAVAVSGIAGPGGGGADKPVGTVYLAWASKDDTVCIRLLFPGDREAVRRQTVQAALQGLLDLPLLRTPG